MPQSATLRPSKRCLSCGVHCQTALELRQLHGDSQVLADILQRHYVGQLLQRSYLVLGAVDAFGNPVNLFRGVAGGVSTFFKEPAQGLALGTALLARSLTC